MDGANELIDGRELGEIHTNARHHAEDVQVLPPLAGSDGGVDGNGIHQDIHVAVVQAIRRGRQVDLGAGIRVGGAGADKEFANAGGDFHDAGNLGGIGEIDRGEWGWRRRGFSRVDDGYLARGSAQTLPHSGQK